MTLPFKVILTKFILHIDFQYAILEKLFMIQIIRSIIILKSNWGCVDGVFLSEYVAHGWTHF